MFQFTLVDFSGLEFIFISFHQTLVAKNTRTHTYTHTNTYMQIIYTHIYDHLRGWADTLFHALDKYKPNLT